MKYIKTYEELEESRNFPLLEYWNIFLKDKTLEKPYKSDAFNFNIYLSEMIKNKRMILKAAASYAGSHWLRNEDVVIKSVFLWQTEHPFTMNINFTQNGREFEKFKVDINSPMEIFGEMTETEKMFLILKDVNKYNI